MFGEGTCQELEPNGLHPIVDYNTVQQVVGLVVYVQVTCTTSVPDEWVYQRSHHMHRVQYPMVASLVHLTGTIP